MLLWRQGANKWDRALAISLIAGLVMLLLVGLVFAIAYGNQRITPDATSLHNASEAVRSSAVVRAQLALGIRSGNVDSRFGSDSSEAIALSTYEATQALTGMEMYLVELAEDQQIGHIDEMGAVFATTANEIIALIGVGNYPAAGTKLTEDLEAQFMSLSSELIMVQDALRERVRSSDALLNQIGNVARLLFAYLIPAAILFTYRDLVRRHARQVELENRLETAHQIAESREEFIANASHELRTPLTSITGLAMLLEEMPTIKEDEASAELVDLMISESVDLNRIVDDLLATARLDAGALSYTFEDVRPEAEIAEVAESLARAGSSIEVACEPAVIRADVVRFRQIVRNLLSNAGKYGGPNVHVLGYVDGANYVCDVVDDGTGVPDGIADRLFDRFVHQGQQTAAQGSVGLGLSIVDALATGMGGKVEYRRVDGETRFSVTMPLVELAESESLGGELVGAGPDTLTA